LAKLERVLGERFHLVTQNVDGLHLRAGNSHDKTFQIHGNINFMRCSAYCTEEVPSIPEEIPAISRDESPPDWVWPLLRCPQCGEITRPHVLLWDETYNEAHYRFQSTLAIARMTDLLVIVGTAGATNLPNQIAAQVALTGGTIIDINIEHNLFSEIATKTKHGFFWERSSEEALPELLAMLESGDR
jgi:NAD-dependent deacetylase